MASGSVVLSSPVVKIQLLDPDTTLPGESRSKAVDPDSKLYKWAISFQAAAPACVGKAVGTERPPHIEVLRGGERASPDVLAIRAARARALHNRDIPVRLTCMGRALVLDTGEAPGFGPTHMTLGFFPAGINEAETAALVELALKLLAEL